jgi:thiamine-phosphate pyrophosphorylase
MSDSSLTLRILDANANRAREALRVMEDYARFILNSSSLSADLKIIRHDLAAALSPILPDAILHRDTAGDVGTTNKTATEFIREDTDHVVTAAGKRFGEANRCLEEFAKTTDPLIAAKLESIRYRFYIVEQTLALTLHTTNRFRAVRLYVLITQAHCAGRPWQLIAEQTIAGGADCLQLREKDLDAGELLVHAREFVALCRKHNVISIINDRVDVALSSNADGVHVGQTDLPARDARRIVGHSKIIGVSTHCLDHARQAVLDGADYIGVGPVFRSATKVRDILPGLDYARQVASEITIPAVAIAGINADNIAQVLSTGLRAVAVTAAVTEQPDVAGAARQLKNAIP